MEGSEEYKDKVIGGMEGQRDRDKMTLQINTNNKLNHSEQ